MTYSIKCEPCSTGGLVATESLLSKIKEFPSANQTNVDLLLVWRDVNQQQSAEVMKWLNGNAEIPSLGYLGKVRPQFLLKALQKDVRPWPGKIILERTLSGTNRTLDYTIELLETAKHCCVRGYELDSGSYVRIGGRSHDESRTPFHVQLTSEEEIFVLSGIAPKLIMQTPAQATLSRCGW